MARKTYTSADRREAAMALLIYDGSTKTAARHLGMPPSTLLLWQRREDWSEIVSTVQDEYEQKYEKQLTGRYDRLVDTAQEQLADRLENGDYVFDKQGQLVRKPMSGKDISVAGGICFDKSRLLKNRPTSIQGNADHRLNDLLEKFRQVGRELAGGRVIEGEVVKDGEPIKSNAENSVQPLFSGTDRDVH